MVIPLKELHKLACVPMADCPSGMEVTWLDGVHDALIATYIRQGKKRKTDKAEHLESLFSSLMDQWNELRGIALARGVTLDPTEEDARSVEEWQTVLLVETGVTAVLRAGGGS